MASQDEIICISCGGSDPRCSAYHPEYGFTCILPMHDGPHYDTGGGHWDENGQLFLDEPAIEIRKAQRLAWANKLTKGFNTTDVPLEFCLLQEELSEAFHAWRRSEPGLGAELADVAIFLLSIAQMNKIDLDSEVQQKIQINAHRGNMRRATTALSGRGKATRSLIICSFEKFTLGPSRQVSDGSLLSSSVRVHSR